MADYKGKLPRGVCIGEFVAYSFPSGLFRGSLLAMLSADKCGAIPKRQARTCPR